MADVTSFVAQFKGTRSMTATATLSGGANDTISSAQLLAAAPTSGAVFDFLNATYANDGAVATAFSATNVGALILQGVSGSGVAGLAWLWKATASKPSVQLVNAGAAGVFNVTLLLEHSVIQ
jgi:hypothetical protein